MAKYLDEQGLSTLVTNIKTLVNTRAPNEHNHDGKYNPDVGLRSQENPEHIYTKASEVLDETSDRKVPKTAIVRDLWSKKWNTDSKVNPDSSLAVGYSTKAIKGGSFATGIDTYAFGYGSTCEGTTAVPYINRIHGHSEPARFGKVIYKKSSDQPSSSSYGSYIIGGASQVDESDTQNLSKLGISTTENIYKLYVFFREGAPVQYHEYTFPEIHEEYLIEVSLVNGQTSPRIYSSTKLYEILGILPVSGHSYCNFIYIKGNSEDCAAFNTTYINPLSTSSPYNTQLEINIPAQCSFGIGSHAEGINNRSLGVASHTEGFGNNANDIGSHAEGYRTAASSQYSHSEGQFTIASGESSHAEGGKTEAKGDYSHAEGYGTIATSSNQHVFGQYNNNQNQENSVEIVGWGTSNTERANIRTLDNTGNMWIKGAIKVGGTGYEDVAASEIPTTCLTTEEITKIINETYN